MVNHHKKGPRVVAPGQCPVVREIFDIFLICENQEVYFITGHLVAYSREPRLRLTAVALPSTGVTPSSSWLRDAPTGEAKEETRDDGSNVVNVDFTRKK